MSKTFAKEGNTLKMTNTVEQIELRTVKELKTLKSSAKAEKQALVAVYDKQIADIDEMLDQATLLNVPELP